MASAMGFSDRLGRLSRLRELLSQLASLGGIGESLGSPEGLERLLELALKLAELAGVEESIVELLKKVLADERLLVFLSGILGRVFGRRAADSQPPAGPRGIAAHDEPDMAAHGFSEWLPLVLQLLQLLAALRGQR